MATATASKNVSTEVSSKSPCTPEMYEASIEQLRVLRKPLPQKSDKGYMMALVLFLRLANRSGASKIAWAELDVLLARFTEILGEHTEPMLRVWLQLADDSKLANIGANAEKLVGMARELLASENPGGIRAGKSQGVFANTTAYTFACDILNPDATRDRLLHG